MNENNLSNDNLFNSYLNTYINIENSQETFKKEDLKVDSNFNNFYSKATFKDEKIIKLVKNNLNTIAKLKPAYKLEFTANGEVVKDERTAWGRSFSAKMSTDYNYDIKNLAVFVTFLKKQSLEKMSPQDAHKLEEKIGKAIKGLDILRNNYVDYKDENCRIIDASKAELQQLEQIMHHNAEEILNASFDELMDSIMLMFSVYSGLPRDKQISEIRKSVHVMGDLARFTNDMPKEGKLINKFVNALANSDFDQITKETLLSEFILHQETINQDKEKVSKLPEQLVALSEQIDKCNSQKHLSKQDKIAFLNSVVTKSGLFDTAMAIKEKVIADLTPEEIQQIPWSSYAPLAQYCIATGMNYALPTALAGVHPLLGVMGQVVAKAALKAAEDNLNTDDPDKIKEKAKQGLNLAAKPEIVKKEFIEKYVGDSKDANESVESLQNEIYKAVEGYMKSRPEKTESKNEPNIDQPKIQPEIEQPKAEVKEPEPQIKPDIAEKK
ncbi:MAG: hypothetical protein H0V82_06635 [Candidatus Protochlamydia sp.]|nr:hypothetical protein [Candidatus Protochlamydia sp.]